MPLNYTSFHQNLSE